MLNTAKIQQNKIQGQNEIPIQDQIPLEERVERCLQDLLKNKPKDFGTDCLKNAIRVSFPERLRQGFEKLIVAKP